MKRKRLRAQLIAATLLSMPMFLLTGCNGANKEASAVFTSSAISETAEPASNAVNTEHVEGKVYTFDKNDAYKFSSAGNAMRSSNARTYGSFSISGSELTEESETENGVASYSVSKGSISIQYAYSDGLLSASEEKWHLVEDNTTSIDDFKIDHDIQNGAIVLQKSMDHVNWHNVSVQSNAFENTPVQNGVLYETTNMDMLNDCYYRLIVVYKLARKVGTSTVAWVIPKDEIEYKRIAEVYEFYVAAKNEHIEPLAENTKRYSLGKTVLVSDFEGYSGTEEITDDDPHYGWKLGNFFVSGFTSFVDSKDEIVFLKNAGDVVTLWFNLAQNINALNQNDKLTITSDPDGHDQYFQTATIDFGKGMLIIRYTDYENVTHDPVLYRDYLSANAMTGADTRVQLFEEGDYEVALDYEVTRKQLIPQTHHYRIFFKFSVRNANCMVFPFDISTGAELTNGSVTENGFKLDLAKSRYLDLNIKKEVWTEGADGLTEDPRFNKATKDGDCYTDEGIYTITVKNKYTGIETTKKIYVGTNRILAAYANSDYSIAEIQRMVEQGATIYEDGSISMPNQSESLTPAASADPPLTEPVSLDNQTSVEPSGALNSTVIVAVVCAVVVALVAAVSGFFKQRSGKEEKK